MALESILLWSHKFIVEFSYIGIFIVSAISTSSIFLPFPLYAITFLISSLGLNPFLVGISSGLGSAVGELTGYFIGAGGRSIVKKNEKKRGKLVKIIMKKIEKYFHKYGFFTILLTSFLPFPFDFVGILAGASEYEIKKFFIATTIGKTIKTLLIAYAGFFSGTFIIHFIESISTI